MKSIFLVLALNGLIVTALPIRHDDASAVATPLHARYDRAGPLPVLTESSSDRPHFPEWLANHPEHIHPKPHRNDWIAQARRIVNTWSAFYSTEYPTKRQRPQSFDDGNDNSLQDEGLLTLGNGACGIVVENSPDGDTTTIAAIPCPSTRYTPPHRPSYFEQLRRNLTTMDLAMLCSRYGPEIVALCIFFLVPISVVLVEIVDVLHDRLVTEKFPERGRGRVRLTGPERRMSVIAKCERERMVRDLAQKAWVGSRRGSRHSH
ncbi:hypothetical protein TSTA_099880 [Talaromyces stipitatus ATCC 10500]|uniref:Uncharacterized protein n=1 Tax=Talaromyces stipitatus (strain ATCC 10500 / CBS 375.48 / QM 6759 / NRRL 1006) TaxID=441959 RepID=B8MMI6_TALSN|nr:uncharacterized protein TSTA_099880 [Talaromyces stipitatus ATCC 10500]EED13740.1 hypothetical protein TSTA_099880 [Talaromyces stipitatus ATCC 10500]